MTRETKNILLAVAGSIAAMAVRVYFEEKEQQRYIAKDLEYLRSSLKSVARDNEKRSIKTIRVTPDSDAEKELMKCMKYTKDGVTCRLGAMFGWDYNEYDFSQADINRLVEMHNAGAI